jgi:macrolide-specific efflux system membrane fusion protein
MRARDAFRPNRSLWHRWSLVLIVLAVVVASVAWSQRALPQAWQTVEVRRGDVEATVSAIGMVQPLRSVEVGAQVSGQLEKLHVAAGDVVKQGQVLAEIDPKVMQATVEAGRAELADLRAQLTDAHAQHDLARLQHERQQQMARDGATRLEDIQIAAAKLKSAAARIAQIEAQITRTSSTLSADEARLGFTRLYARIDGTVTSVDVKEGQTLNATYQTPTVLRLADMSRMTVWAEVAEADIGRVHVGMPLHFTTLAGDRRRWTATARLILPAPPVKTSAGNNTNTATSNQSSPTSGSGAVHYPVLCDVDNPDGALRPQMTAQVTFLVASRKNVLTAPLAAFAAAGNEPDLYEARVITSDGTPPQNRRVRLGIRDQMLVVIVDGLAEGDRLVIAAAPSPSSARRLFQW